MSSGSTGSPESPRFLHSRPQRFALLSGLVATAVIGFLPLFGGPGYEAALASGLVLPALAACATAVDVSRARLAPFDALGRGVASGISLAALGFAVTWTHGLRVGVCDAVEGSAFYCLGPGLGAVLGGMWGATAGLAASLVGRGRVAFAFVLALAAPLAGVGVSLYRFYTSPIVFAFDPFFGFFAGTLYDTVITGLPRLSTYRVGTLMTFAATTAAFACLERGAKGGLVLSYEKRPGTVFLAAVFAAGSIAHSASGVRLGHFQTTDSIREELGHVALSDRCEVVYPGSVLKRDAHMLARECDAHVAELEKYFETKGPQRTVVFVFASPEQKGALMGAARTFIAKPWRKEVYVQGAGYPHRVLRHELAHVVAGSFGEGPFRVSGPLGGLIPDPGRIEGLAVAAAPNEDDLTLSQWARAMQKLELLPPLHRVFKLTFLGEPSSRAYAVAGAFTAWLREGYGAKTLKAWYAGRPLEESTKGKSLSALEREWLASLEKVSISDEAMHVARARFGRPAIFARRCPHVVDQLSAQAGWALGQLDIETAKKRYERVLELDGTNVDARLGLGTCALREGDTEGARSAFEKIAEDERLPRAVRARAIENRADLELVVGNAVEAVRGYRKVAESVVDEDHLRTLDVKAFAAESAEARPAIVQYLIGDPRLGREPTAGAAELGAWAEKSPKQGLSDYLLGRNYFARGRFELAAQHMDRALSKALSLPRIRAEARRTRLVVACALGDGQRARSLFDELAREPQANEARLEVLRSFIRRCAPSNETARAR